VINFQIDQSRNLFVIRYLGHIQTNEVKDGLEEIRAAIPDLQPGFRLLGDLSELESMEVGCAPFIEQAMDLFNAKGVALIVRVIPDPQRDIGMNIMSIFHYEKAVRIINCQTLPQAKEALRADLAES